jgi:hypothetical protein
VSLEPPPKAPPVVDPRDVSDLNSLAMAHRIVGGLGMICSFLPLIHVSIGYMLITSPPTPTANGGAPPIWFGWLFLIVGLLAMIVGFAISFSLVVSANMLQERRNHKFSFVVACLACLQMPIGTILGVFTIIVLSRESVKAMYSRLD